MQAFEAAVVASYGAGQASIYAFSTIGVFHFIKI